MEMLLDNGLLFQHAVVAVALALGLLVEAMGPFRRQALRARCRRWAVNVGLALVNGPILFGTSLLLAWAIEDLGLGGLALLDRVGAGFWASLMATLLLAEFVSYWLHRAHHAVPFLWRLHRVHHSDTAPDVTTTHRHHPGEAFIGAVAAVPTFWVLGPTFEASVAVAALWTVVATFSHANVRVGGGLQALLGRIIVTPDYHRVHHSADPAYANTHFGTVIPLYDHLFRTARRWTPAWQATAPMGVIRA